MALIISYEDRKFTFDTRKINVDEWRELKRKYAMSPKAFEEGLREVDPDAYTFLYWLMLRWEGDRHITLGDHLKPDIVALHAAIADGVSDEPDEAQAEPDPTQDDSLPDTPTRISNGSSKVTSAKSATSTSSPSRGSVTSVPGTSMN